MAAPILPAIPALRKDLKVSRQVMSEKVGYIVKDPIKGEYFRFEDHEWRIIELFDGKRTVDEAVLQHNANHPLDPIDAEVLKDFQKSLEGMNLIEKSRRDMNVMLIEKMKETRKSMLLSKEGSLMYKRFPLVDPDKFFDRVIPGLGFFWTKSFFVISALTMLLAMVLVGFRIDEFSNGVFEVFSFSKMSVWNMAFLWVTIYTVIAIHELGHGLTCKQYGGEVHEIGFLLLFFQPCLYANVNDAWLFDKKWKQVMVTIAGGYIEFFVGSLFAIVWAVSNPNTLLNVLCLQVMTICSISTVIFNFNPLVKLDGYYLLADYLEIPNLRDSSFGYLKALVCTKLFGMPESEELEASPRERRAYLIYGAMSFFWVFSTTTGLFYMAKGMLIEHLHEFGVILSFWVAYKIFGGHVKKSGLFGLQWFIKNREFLTSRTGKIVLGSSAAFVLAVLFLPIPYRVPGKCSLSAISSEIVRASTDGVIQRFDIRDGSSVRSGDSLLEIENNSIKTDLEITRSQVMKLEIESRAAIQNNIGRVASLAAELNAKREILAKTHAKVEGMKPKVVTRDVASIASCPDQARKVNAFVKEGDEICRIHAIDQLKAVIEVKEQDVRFIKIGDAVDFRLESQPFKTYRGTVSRIQSLSIPDPINPKARLYNAELLINNLGDLRPGMTGLARVSTGWIPLGKYIGRNLASFFRLDLFF